MAVVDPVDIIRGSSSSRVSRGGAVRGVGTGSYPPGWKGWQRSSRRIASPIPRSAPCARDRLQRVGAAGRVEPTAGRQCRAYPTTVRDDGQRQRRGHASVVGRRRLRHAVSPRPATPVCRARARRGERRVQVGAELLRTSGRPPPAAPAPPRRRRPAGRPAGRATRCRSRRLDLVADHRAADRLGHHEAGARRGAGSHRRGRCCRSRHAVRRARRWTTTRAATGAPAGRTAAAKSRCRRSRCAAASIATLRTAVVRPTGGRGPWPGAPKDRAAGAGAHAQPEAVGLRAPAVVRLEGALAHVRPPSSYARGRESSAAAPTGRPRCAAKDTRSRRRRTAHPPPYQRATEQPLQAYACGDDRQTPAQRVVGTRPARRRSDRRSSRRRDDRLWTTVEALWTTLLACPVAGLRASGDCAAAASRAKPD